MYDVAIVGAGPAGSTLARLLGGRYRVLLVDCAGSSESTSPMARRVGKLCGGLLAPAAQKELARQGLGVPSSLLAGPQLFAVRALDCESGLERRYQRHYVNIDRHAFDAWLVSLATDHCDYRPEWRFTGLDQGAPSPLLHFRTAAGGVASVAARLVVGADGAGSAVRRAAFPTDSPTRYVALQASFAEEHSEACYGAVFAPALTDYYGWTIPKGGTVNVGAAFPRSANVVSRFADLVHELRVAGFGIGDELERASAPLLKPTVPSDLRLARREVALVGEAAGFISPSSAEGISYALRSAAALAAAIDSAPHDPAYEYRRFARPLVAEVLGKMVKSRILQTKGLRRAALLTGVGALPEGDIDGFAGSLGELLMP